MPRFEVLSHYFISPSMHVQASVRRLLSRVLSRLRTHRLSHTLLRLLRLLRGALHCCHSPTGLRLLDSEKRDREATGGAAVVEQGEGGW